MRNSTIDSLQTIKRIAEKSYHKRTISKISGASAAIVGSSLAIVGFGLSFVTFGASLGLTIVGGAIAAAGGITMGGADIGDFLKSKSFMKRARTITEHDKELSTEVHGLAERLSQLVEQLSLMYPTYSREDIFAMISGIIQGQHH